MKSIDEIRNLIPNIADNLTDETVIELYKELNDFWENMYVSVEKDLN